MGAPKILFSVELDLSNPPDVSAMVVCPTGGDITVQQGGKLASSASMGMTVQKTLSIPMMMRALMKGLNGKFSLWMLEILSTVELHNSRKNGRPKIFYYFGVFYYYGFLCCSWI